MYKERRLAVKFNAVAEWFRYSPFQYVILTAIDIAQSASTNHGLVRYWPPNVQGNVQKSIKSLCIDHHNK